MARIESWKRGLILITICLVLFVSATLLFETLLGYWYMVIVKKSKFCYAGSVILISRCRWKKKYWSLVAALCFNSGCQLFSDVVWFIALNRISRVIDYIFLEVDKHVDAGDLLREYKMSALPILYDQFVKLIKYLVHPFNPSLYHILIVVLLGPIRLVRLKWRDM